MKQAADQGLDGMHEDSDFENDGICMAMMMLANMTNVDSNEGTQHDDELPYRRLLHLCPGRRYRGRWSLPQKARARSLGLGLSV